jgi:hypothetical protein
LPLPWHYVSAAEPAKVPTTFTVVLPSPPLPSRYQTLSRLGPRD